MPNFIEEDWPPYVIEFEDKLHEFWGPASGIKANDKPPQSKEAKQLRFKVGDRVECKVQVGQCQDEMRYSPGTVVATNYWERTFEGSFTAPYQVKLDEVGEGFPSLIFAPMDDDMLIRASTVPPPQCWICYENHMTEDNLIVRECGCKGGTNGFVHVECLVKLAKSKANFDAEVTDFDTQIFPFMGCITCRQPFELDSHCGIALSKMFYDITKDLGVENVWGKMAVTKRADTLKECKEYDRAKEILQERISRIREKIEVEIGLLNEEEGGGITFDVNFGHRALNPTLYRLLKDLASFLLELAGVYEKKELMNEMKEVAEEALLISKSLEEHKVPGPGSGSKVEVLQTLGVHAYDTGDKRAALSYTEEALRFKDDLDDLEKQTFLPFLLWRAGNLNIQFGKHNRGRKQLADSYSLYAERYGNTKAIQDLKKEMEELCKVTTTTPYEAIQQNK